MTFTFLSMEIDGPPPFGLHYEDGWVGILTRESAPGALFANGSRVMKALGRESDAHPVGARGRVIGSMPHLKKPEARAYFIEWDTHPKMAFCVSEWKLARSER